jgi:hypothetical protein
MAGEAKNAVSASSTLTNALISIPLKSRNDLERGRSIDNIVAALAESGADDCRNRDYAQVPCRGILSEIDMFCQPSDPSSSRCEGWLCGAQN